MGRGLSGLSGLGEDYRARVLATRPASLVAYWMLAEASGATIVDSSGNARDGLYSGVSLGQTGSGDGRTAALFDGATAYGNVYSTSLRDALNFSEMTIVQWLKIPAAAWTDATLRRAIFLSINASNRATLYKSGASDALAWQYLAGGVTQAVSKVFAGGGPTDWLSMGMTISKSADQLIAYYNGAQEGAPQTGLGVSAGTLNPANGMIGATAATPTAPFHGWLAHAAVWNVALTAGEMAALGRR